ncbi:hypothetical protein, partial [Klebsiella pneumoniae]|uniref:hypothetical protein n=1 Tax=Klebsiella pneumoniae TaxID=573 RepID=UPI00195327A9
ALELNRISRDVDYELHKVEEHFDRLRSDLTTLIEARFSNLPQGLLQFQPKLLLAPGMSYLRLNLGGPNDHIPAGSR